MSLDLALARATFGPVFRLLPGTKQPRDKWVNGPTYATTDEHEIRRRWTARPRAGVGLACGYPLDGGYLAVLDLDVVGGCRAACPDWAIETRTATTRSGGQHRYYVTERPVKNSAGRLATGVDVRGSGGMVVAYPFDNDLPVARLDARLFETYAPRVVAGVPVSGTIRLEPVQVADGQWHEQLIAWGSYLYRLDSEKAAGRLAEINEQFPGWSGSERDRNHLAGVVAWFEGKEAPDE